jgi:hypothetical protein
LGSEGCGGGGGGFEEGSAGEVHGWDSLDCTKRACFAGYVFKNLAKRCLFAIETLKFDVVVLRFWGFLRCFSGFHDF